MSEIPNLFLLIDETQDLSKCNFKSLSELNKWEPNALEHMCIWSLVIKKPTLDWNWNSLSQNRSIREKYIVPLRQRWNWEILSRNLSVSMRFIADNKLLPWDLIKIIGRSDYDHDVIYGSLNEDEKKSFPTARGKKISQAECEISPYYLTDLKQLRRSNRYDLSGFCHHNDSLVMPINVGGTYGGLEYYEYYGMTEFEKAKHKCRNVKEFNRDDINMPDGSHSHLENFFSYNMTWKCMVNLWNVIKIMALNFDKDGKIIRQSDDMPEFLKTLNLEEELDETKEHVERLENNYNQIKKQIDSIDNYLNQLSNRYTILDTDALRINAISTRLSSIENIIQNIQQNQKNELKSSNEDCQSHDITVHTKRLSAVENTPREVIQPGEFDSSLRDLLFKLPNKEWDFAALSRNRNINDEILLKFIDKPWNFAELSRNRNVSITFIITYAHFAWDWTEISSRSDITAAIVLEHADKPWDFAALSKIL